MIGDFFTIFPFMVCAFWTAVFLLDWSHNPPSKHMLVLFMSVASVLYLCHSLFFDPRCTGPVLAVANCIYAFCNLAVFPLYYLYICRLTESRRLTARQWSILLPSVAVFVWACLQTLLMPHSEGTQALRFLVTKIVFVVQLVPVCWYGWKRLRDFDVMIDNSYSSTEQRRVANVRHLIVVLVAGGLISVVANYLGREWFSENSALLALPSTLFGALLFAVGYVGMRQNFDADDFARDSQEGDMEELDLLEDSLTVQPNHEATDSIDDVVDAEVDEYKASTSDLMVRLEALMDKERLYLQPDLKITDVALRLGVGRTTLSQAINKNSGASFNDYVNAMRVAYAQEIMQGEEEFSLQYVSELAGFSSEASFYRAFRRHTSLTPRQWTSRKDKNLK